MTFESHRPFQLDENTVTEVQYLTKHFVEKNERHFVQHDQNCEVLLLPRKPTSTMHNMYYR